MESQNETKAKEIATRWKAKGLPYNAIYETAIEVLEWKEQQLIDEACKWWENEFTYPTMAQAEINWYQTKIAEFKKAMKGER